MATDTSSRSLLYANREAAEAAARGLREAGFSHILISEGALPATAPPTLREFWEECVALLRRFARPSAHGRLAAQTQRASSFARSLCDLGVASEQATEISRRICEGAALLTVRSPDAADRALAVMQAFAEQAAATGVARRSSAEGVRVRKVVITELKRVEVPVQREVLVIERASGVQDGEVEEVRIPLTHEEVRIDKHTVVSKTEGDASPSDERPPVAAPPD